MRDRARFMALGLSLALLLGSGLAGCVARASRSASPPHTDPAAGQASGEAQSPIDLPSEGQAGQASHRVAIHYHETAEHIIHREHTVEVDVDDGSTLEFDGRSYTLDQFHFHTPSEHLIGGRRYPLELHLVHLDEQRRVLVVGILFEAGEASSFVERILRDTPADLGRIDRRDKLDLSELVALERHFYLYRGSFTTPPYSESVDWLVSKHHPEASAEQIVRLLVLEGGNARPVQQRNARVVEDF